MVNLKKAEVPVAMLRTYICIEPAIQPVATQITTETELKNETERNFLSCDDLYILGITGIRSELH